MNYNETMLLNFYPKYIKKEDVREYYKNRQLRLGCVLIALAISTGFINFIVFPKIITLYEEFEVTLQAQTLLVQQIVPYILVIISLYGLYLLFFHPKDEFIETQLSSYKSEEMININKLSTHKEEFIIFAVLLFLTTITIVGAISPIYNLVSTF